MMPNNVSVAETTMTYTREVRQRWGVFMLVNEVGGAILREKIIEHSSITLVDQKGLKGLENKFKPFKPLSPFLNNVKCYIKCIHA